MPDCSSIDLTEAIKLLKYKTRPRPKRCEMDSCNARLTLTDMACKCSGYFCSGHRHAEVHSCTYDFKALYKEQLQKNLVEVKGSKVDTI